MAYELINFQEEVIGSSFTLPVIVDFWATWCEPCGMLEPIITSLAEENKGQWQFIKVNFDEHPELAKEYNIMGIPALRIFYKGEIIASFNGLMWKPQLREWIDGELGKIALRA